MFLVLNCLAVLSLEVDILYWLKTCAFCPIAAEIG